MMNMIQQLMNELQNGLRKNADERIRTEGGISALTILAERVAEAESTDEAVPSAPVDQEESPEA